MLTPTPRLREVCHVGWHSRSAKFSSRHALGGTLAIGTGPTAVKVFTEEDLPLDSVIGMAYTSRCSGGDPSHAAIQAELQADLATKTAAPGAVLSEQPNLPLLPLQRHRHALVSRVFARAVVVDL